MSHKRPTESTWDSDDDDDLLNDNTSSINAFADEDIDEDALLGDSDEDIDASSVGEAIVAGMDHGHFESESAEFGAKHEEEEEVLDVVVDEDEEDEILGLTAGSEFDDTNYSNFSEATHGENVSTNISVEEEVEPETEEIGSQLVKEEAPEEAELDVSAQTQEEEEEEEDEESDDDDDKNHRGRFKSERSDSVGLKSSRQARDNIPDTLEISAEEQARIDEMQNQIDSKRHNRGRRGRNGGRGGRGRYQQQQFMHRHPGNFPGNQNNNIPGLLGHRPGLMPSQQGPRAFGRFPGPHNQRMHLHQQQQQQLQQQQQQQARMQPQQPLMQPLQQPPQQQQQQQPRPQPPYPVPSAGQPRAVIHINPHFRPRASTYSGPQTVQAGPVSSVTPTMSMGQTQLTSSNMGVPSVLQGPHNQPFQQRPLLHQGWSGNQSQPPPQQLGGQRLPFSQVSQQQQHMHQPFQQNQQNQMGIPQMRQQGPGGMQQNRNTPNQSGVQTQNQGPPNFLDRSPPLNEAPWNRTHRYQGPGPRQPFTGGPTGQQSGPQGMQQQQSHNHHPHHQQPPPYHHNQSQQPSQPQRFPLMPQNQNINRSQPPTDPRERFQGPHSQNSGGNPRFGFQGQAFGSPPGSQQFPHQMQQPRQPGPQGQQQRAINEDMEQAPQPIQTVLRGVNSPVQRAQPQGKQRQPQKKFKPESPMQETQNTPQPKKQEMSEERKKMLMRQRRFAASGAVKVTPGTKIKLATARTGQSMAAAKKLQMAHQRQVALKRRSNEIPEVSPPKQVKKMVKIEPVSPAAVKVEKPAVKIASAEDMLNADLADKLEKQARLRDAIIRKKEERRLAMAQERRQKLKEDLESQGLTLEDIEPQEQEMPPPTKPVLKAKQQNQGQQKKPQHQHQQQQQQLQYNQQQKGLLPNPQMQQQPGKKVIKMTKSQYQAAQFQGKNVQAVATKQNPNQRGRGRGGHMRGRGRGQGHIMQQQQHQQHQIPQQGQGASQPNLRQITQTQGPPPGQGHPGMVHQNQPMPGGGRGRGVRGHVHRGAMGTSHPRGAMQKQNQGLPGLNPMHQGGPQGPFHQQLQGQQPGPQGNPGWSHRGRGNPGNMGNRGALAQANRTVVPPGQSHQQGPQPNNRRIVLGNEPMSKNVLIRNLNTSTPIQQIEQMSWQMGHVENIRRVSQTDCYVTFATPEQAMAFRNKYNRYMLDLSMLNIDFAPA